MLDTIRQEIKVRGLNGQTWVFTNTTVRGALCIAMDDLRCDNDWFLRRDNRLGDKVQVGKRSAFLTHDGKTVGVKL